VPRAGQQRQVPLAGNRLGAERPQEGRVPLGVDEQAAGRAEPLGHVRDRDPRRAAAAAE
jgi:hypothetical protein